MKIVEKAKLYIFYSFLKKKVYFKYESIITYQDELIRMTQSKISVSLGSSHIWRIYLSVNVISMCGSEQQHEDRSIGNISINYEHIRANKSPHQTVINMKVITKVVKKSDKATLKTGVFNS